jgi:CHAT domain-containing protein/Tfp pilus assembly protein PilF
VVEQQGIDASVALEDPSGVLVLKVDRLINDRGPELVLAVAETDGIHTLIVRGGPESHPGRYEARVETLRPASPDDRRSAAAYRSFTAARDLKAEEAWERSTQALATWRELGEVALQGEALESLATQHYNRGERQQAVNLYRQAALALERAGDRHWEGLVRNELAANLLTLGETQEAADQYSSALSLAQRTGDRLEQAAALQGLGRIFENQGELQQALDHYNAALALWPKGEPRRPNTLHSLGVLYARYLHDESRGRELLLQARDTWGLKQDRAMARTLSQLGRLAYEQGRGEEAGRDYEKALTLQQDDRCGSAVYQARLALVKQGQGARTAADDRLAEALRIVAAQPCPRSEPTVHLLAAEIAEKRGDNATARAYYHRSETLLAGEGDRLGVAESLAGVARNAHALGDREGAREASRRVLAIIEDVRPTVLREDLRTSFFSGARQAFDFHIDLLRELGAEEEAWATAERARARALGDLLAEAGAGLRRDAAPDLAARERELQRSLNALESRRLLGTSETNVEKLRSLRQSIDAKVADLESLRGELRRRSPRYTALVRPEPVTLAAVRQELLDADTVLLEYRLGEAASTLWVVTRDSLTAARLPPRGVIEPLAREAASWMQSLEWPGSNPRPLCELSRMLLAPAAPALGHRRLVVVPDGALEVLSFAALPDVSHPEACPAAPPLVEAHEIVYLPSAATLLTQRRLLAGRRPAAGWLAVVADPVYSTGDERLQGHPVRRGTGSAEPFRRLPGSAEEAKAIVAGLPPERVSVATGFAASRQTVTSGALHGFRILHFAAHGLLNAEQPLLSALAFSQLDPSGKPVDGLLPAHDLYDLDLPAELVVLSACETALGREVAGEGLVSGLPRAFLYAGSARVLVSLWPVEDESTRELMALFYRGLFARGLAPARALQEAQRAMARSGRAPSRWAGFVLLGDWRPLPPFSR